MATTAQLVQQHKLATWTAEMLPIDGHRIAASVRSGGDGRPLVLLHGITGSVEFWPAMLPSGTFLSRPCAAVSLPGHAPSTVPAGFTATDVTVRLFADVVADAIQELFGGSAVHLAGWSTGGFSALAVAAYHPHLVASATSICGFARGQWGDLLGVMQRLAGGGKSGRLMFRQGLAAMARHRWVYNRIMRRFAGERISDSADTLVNDVLFQELSAHDPTVLAEVMGGLRAVDLSEALQQITAPVLVIGGRRDPVIPFAETQHLASTIATAELLELEDSGHLFFAEAPARTVQAMDKWVELHD